VFFSTRNAALRVSSSVALLEGISPDGGLFLPEAIVPVDYKTLKGSSYPELAFSLLRPYLEDFSDQELREAVTKAYSPSSFPEKIFDLHGAGNHAFLELFHGLTLTFKDMALSLLPQLMDVALSKHPEVGDVRILTATSGDTGSAVLSSFASSKHVKVSVLYPEGGIAPFQERQMLSFTSLRGRAYALKNANFDDCQTLVKKLLLKKEAGVSYSSANSINIGRLLPQIVYYYAAYIGLIQKGFLKEDEPLDVVVPTGNFGDIFAAYLAKKMGLPLRKLVVASNANDVLTDFFASGVYDIHRSFLKTNSPSMDILVSSNLERLLYLSCLDDRKVASWEQELKGKGAFQVDSKTLGVLQRDFLAYSAGEEETRSAIKSSYQEGHYLIDPHTAVGYAVYKKSGLKKVLLVATASPFKFPKTVMASLGDQEADDFAALEKMIAICGDNAPSPLEKALKSPTAKKAVSPVEFAKLISPRLAYEVKAPATSANLGPGFDVMGIALSLDNHFRFAPAKEDALKGFVGEEETKDNLILKSYRRYFEAFALPYQPVEITQIASGIPLSRGLGSSASCIVAGLLGANAISGDYLPKEKLLSLATAIEGHPDNVAPCLFGGLIASYKNEKGEVVPLRHVISPKLGFLLLVSPQELSTEKARGILPKAYALSDITFDASRLANLPDALEKGDLALLQDLLKDRLHVPYRLPLIEDGDLVRKAAEEAGFPFTISGAGSSLLVLYRKDDSAKKDALVKTLKRLLPASWRYLELSDEKSGASVKEVLL
jgi:threonine synthase